MEDKRNTMTRAWMLYQNGISYNNRLIPNQYNVVNTNQEFITGNQWINLPTGPAGSKLPRPVFNILKRVASLFIASLTSSGTAIHFEPLAYYTGGDTPDPDHNAAEVANAMVETLLEKFKFDYRVRDALFDGAVTGDYCAHFWFDPTARPFGSAPNGLHKGELRMELVDGINVIFANPNSRDIQSQDYVLLIGRDTVEHLRWEQEQYRKNRETMGRGTAASRSDVVTSDAEYQWQTGVGGKIEMEPTDETNEKALYVYLYTKQQHQEDAIDPETGEVMMVDELDENGMPILLEVDGMPVLDDAGLPVTKQKPLKRWVTTVHVTKATRSAVIFEDVDTGLSLYPLAWGNWEKQKNQYHGRALVTGLVPNQIFINTMFATAMRHLQLTAFQKTVYNADLISSWNNEVGQAIGVHGLPPGSAINQVATVLPVAEMSAQIFTLIDKAIEYTKECLGATDAQMGNVNPENTSALMVLQTNAEVPLENIRAGLYEWVEDIGQILLDMMGTYYGTRPVIIDQDFDEPVVGPGGAPVLDPVTGMMQTQKFTRKVAVDFDFNIFKHLYLNLRVDVGATTYFSEIAMTQTLDNLRADGTLDVIQYLERIPEKLIPKKRELIEELKGRIAAGTQANAAAGAALPKPGSPLQNPGAGVQQGAPLDPESAVQGLPTQMEAGFDALPNIAKKTALTMGAMGAS